MSKPRSGLPRCALHIFPLVDHRTPATPTRAPVSERRCPRLLTGLVILAVCVAALGPSTLGPSKLWAGEIFYPGETWPERSLEELGVDPEPIDRAIEFAGDGSGVVILGGYRAAFWGSQISRYDVKSTTKSIGSLLLGLAIDEGLVGLDDAAEDYRPAFATPPEENIATGWTGEITLRHLATHSAGFDLLGGYTELVYEPGTRWFYSDGGTNWLAECLTLVYGEDLDSVLQRRLLDKIGIADGDLVWRRNFYRPQQLEGIELREFGSGIRCSVDNLARLGYLLLRDGRWEDEQILSRAWVESIGRPQLALDQLPPHDADIAHGAPQHYGLLWWNNGDASIEGVPDDAFWSWGLNESLILVVPSLDLVAARAGSAWQTGWQPDFEVVAPWIRAMAEAAESALPPAVHFRRGDLSADGRLSIGDAIQLLDALFREVVTLDCPDSGDFNADDTLGITDAIALLNWLFLDFGASIPLPGAECGPDPTPREGLGCGSFEGC